MELITVIPGFFPGYFLLWLIKRGINYMFFIWLITEFPGFFLGYFLPLTY